MNSMHFQTQYYGTYGEFGPELHGGEQYSGHIDGNFHGQASHCHE
jgi:hypothetical protein